mmetsp:Transcript_19566/g.48396  ORF Transcript_19566/g.48396 Transcript_19566/m.48396 type:complete len:249 (-) Transcript_19566:3551-4297(-)
MARVRTRHRVLCLQLRRHSALHQRGVPQGRSQRRQTRRADHRAPGAWHAVQPGDGGPGGGAKGAGGDRHLPAGGGGGARAGDARDQRRGPALRAGAPGFGCCGARARHGRRHVAAARARREAGVPQGARGHRCDGRGHLRRRQPAEPSGRLLRVHWSGGFQRVGTHRDFAGDQRAAAGRRRRRQPGQRARERGGADPGNASARGASRDTRGAAGWRAGAAASPRAVRHVRISRRRRCHRTGHRRGRVV